MGPSLEKHPDACPCGTFIKGSQKNVAHPNMLVLKNCWKTKTVETQARRANARSPKLFSCRFAKILSEH